MKTLGAAAAAAPIFHLVSGPGGIIEVEEDSAGHLSARLRTGYVISNESEEQVLEQALRTVKTILGHDQVNLNIRAGE